MELGMMGKSFQSCADLCTIDRLPVAVYVLQKDRFVAYNSAAIELLGHPTERLERANYWDLCAPWIRDQVRDRGRAWMGGARMDAHGVCSVVNERGDEKWIEVFRRLIAVRGSPALLVAALELTERRARLKNSGGTIKYQTADDVPLNEGGNGFQKSNEQPPSSEAPHLSGVRALTERQYEVLELVQRGLSNKQIAFELAITEGTAKLHIYHLMRIFNVPNRTLLALAALKAPR